MKNEKEPVPKLAKKKKFSWTRDDTELTLLGLPATIWFAVFAYLPLFGLIVAFKDYRLQPGMGFLGSLFASKWAGFKNFTFFLTSNTFAMLLRNTLLYNLVFIIINLVVPVTLAIVINQLFYKMASKCYQTLMFFPYFMSWVVVSYFVYAFLVTDKGLLNSLIRALGGENIGWYTTGKYWPFILVFMHIWKTLGYNMVVYLASITGIDTSLYEAASLDGASKFQQAIYVTLPSLRPIIIMMFILSVGHIFSSDFGLFFQVSQGANQPLTSWVATLDVQTFLMLNSPSVTIGQTSAASMFQAVVGCITILSANAIVRKFDRSSALI